MVYFARDQTSSREIFFIFFAKRRKLVDEMIYQRKNRGHQTSKIVESRQSYSNGHLPYHRSLHYLVRAFMHDLACEFDCIVRMRRNN